MNSLIDRSIGCLLLLALYAGPREFQGKVVSVHDGDCLTVVSNGAEHKIRIHGIDAPELNQPHGRESLAALRELTVGKQVRLVHRGASWNRKVCEVWIADRDIGREMLESGHAWHDVRFDRQNAYGAAEIDAQEARRGLWSETWPVAPWVFRQAGREYGRRLQSRRHSQKNAK